jgi:8-oxo-dGTP pyrophosphatase MutT (NUDIX family)
MMVKAELTAVPIRAAVLVPVCENRDERGVILTERAAGVATHAGQVAFPGGRHDPSRDTSLVETALRETFEEIGLPGEKVEVIAALPERRTLSSNYLITPFVGRVPSSFPFHLDPREVCHAFFAPLSVFSRPERRERFVWTHGAEQYEVPFVAVGERRVWGVTLEIVDDLLGELKGLLERHEGLL